MTFPSSGSKPPHNTQHPNNVASHAHSSTSDLNARAIAAVRRLADCQSDPHLAAAIARLIPRPPGRPRAKSPTPTQQRDELLRRLRRTTYGDLPGIIAAGDILRDWRRYRHGNTLPADEPRRTFWRIAELATPMPAQRSIENIIAKQS